MNDGITIGGTTTTPRRSEYRDALAQYVGTRETPGTPWTELDDRDRERLCCLHAAEECRQDATATIPAWLEAMTWDRIESAIPKLAISRNPAHDLATRQRADIDCVTLLREIAQLWSDRAMDWSERVVRADYLEAWDAAMADPPDVLPPEVGR